MKKAMDSPCFQKYISKYKKRSANLLNMTHADELVKIDSQEELFFAPMESIFPGTPPIGQRGNGTHKYLWVIMDDGVWLLLEEGEACRCMNRGYASHTNITGNVEAYSGGELWFESGGRKMWLSGGSSRYQPRNEEELNEIASWFEQCEYTVVNFGWDPEVARPSRFLRTG